MSSLITYDEMKAALERAVAERGEGYVYEAPDPGLGCVYRDAEDKPSCIVGLAMSYLRPDLRLRERTALEVLEGIAEPRAIVLAHAVQVAQDAQYTWGAALAYGLEHVESLSP